MEHWTKTEMQSDKGTEPWPAEGCKKERLDDPENARRQDRAGEPPNVNAS